MQKKIVILLVTLVVAFVFCGAASATSVKTNQINTAKISNLGAVIHKPDLTPTSIKVSIVKGHYYVTLGVKNKGTKASHSFISTLYMDGKLLGSVKYAAASIGKTVTGTKELPQTTKPGNHQFKTSVDPKNQIAESNEKNNIKQEEFKLAPLNPTILEIMSLKVEPNSGKAERIKEPSSTTYWLEMPVKVVVAVKNISKYPIVKLAGYTGIANPDDSAGCDLCTIDKSYAKNPIKQGQIVLITINSTMRSIKLGYTPGKVFLTAWTEGGGQWDMDKIFKNVFQTV
jgi:hypothetical protein